MIIPQPNLVISDPSAGWGDEANGDNPVIGWNNIVTAANVAAGAASDDSYPVSNLANPATNILWKGLSPTAANSLTVTPGGADPIDYLAFARHNLGTLPRTVGVSVDTGSGMAAAIDPVLLADNSPVLFRLNSQSMAGIRLDIGACPGGVDQPFIGVLYVGKLLVLQRRIYVGHTPIVYGRDVDVESEQSETGEFLGRIITGESRSTTFTLGNMTPDWYRAYMDPFVEASAGQPFFFAWRPSSYPSEVGFAWTTNKPRPKNSAVNGMMSVDLSLNGVS